MCHGTKQVILRKLQLANLSQQPREVLTEEDSNERDGTSLPVGNLLRPGMSTTNAMNKCKGQKKTRHESWSHKKKSDGRQCVRKRDERCIEVVDGIASRSTIIRIGLGQPRQCGCGKPLHKVCTTEMNGNAKRKRYQSS